MGLNKLIAKLLTFALSVQLIAGDITKLEWIGSAFADTTCSSGLEYNAILGRCLSSESASKVAQASATCNSMSTDAAKKQCFADAAEGKLKEAETSGQVSGAGKVKGDTLSTLLTLAGLTSSVLFLALGGSACPGATSAYLIAGGSVAVLAGEMLASSQYKKKMQAAKEALSKSSGGSSDASSGTSESSNIQAEAFDALIKQEDAVISASSTKKKLYMLATAAYAAATVMAGLELFRQHIDPSVHCLPAAATGSIEESQNPALLYASAYFTKGFSGSFEDFISPKMAYEARTFSDFISLAQERSMYQTGSRTSLKMSDALVEDRTAKDLSNEIGPDLISFAAKAMKFVGISSAYAQATVSVGAGAVAGGAASLAGGSAAVAGAGAAAAGAGAAAAGAGAAAAGAGAATAAGAGTAAAGAGAAAAGAGAATAGAGAAAAGAGAATAGAGTAGAGAAAASGGLSASPAALAFKKLYVSPVTRIALAGVLTLNNVYMMGKISKEENKAKERKKFLEELKAQVVAAGEAFGCTGTDRGNPAKPQCYCYDDTGAFNTARNNSSICQALNKGNSLASTGYSTSSGDAIPTSCTNSSGKLDTSCACKATNSCVTITSAAAGNSTGGISVADTAGTVNSLNNGSLNASQIDADAAKAAAARYNNAAAALAAKNPAIKQGMEKAKKIATDATAAAERSLASSGASLASAGGFGSLGDGSSSLMTAKTPEEALQKVKMDIARNEAAASKASGKSEELDFSGIGSSNGPAGGVVMDQQMTAAMDQALTNSNSDINTDSNTNLFDILSSRYQRSGMRRLFGGEALVPAEAPSTEQVNK